MNPDIILQQLNDNLAEYYDAFLNMDNDTSNLISQSLEILRGTHPALNQE